MIIKNIRPYCKYSQETIFYALLLHSTVVNIRIFKNFCRRLPPSTLMEKNVVFLSLDEKFIFCLTLDALYVHTLRKKQSFSSFHWRQSCFYCKLVYLL